MSDWNENTVENPFNKQTGDIEVELINGMYSKLKQPSFSHLLMQDVKRWRKSQPKPQMTLEQVVRLRKQRKFYR